MRPCDTFMFYVIGHGRKSSGTIGIRDGSFGAKTFFSSKIKTVPACHILIHADNCYSGKLIRSGGKFISKIQKQLKDKEVLMITSTDPDKGVLFWDAENKFHIAFDLVGSAVCNYFAANGVYANWRNLLGMAGQIDDAKGAFLTNTIKRHNSQYFYQLGNPAKCDPACLVEEEDNDTKEKAQVVPTNAEGGACMLGEDRAGSG